MADTGGGKHSPFRFPIFAASQNNQVSDSYNRIKTIRHQVIGSSGKCGLNGHSPFARAFIGALNKNDAVMDGTTLFNEVRRPVMLSADQTPEYSDVRRAGHEGGDFLFVRRR